MSLNSQREPYVAIASFVARKPFPFNGVEFNVGDDFPGNKLDFEVDPRKMKAMYNAGYFVQTLPNSKPAKKAAVVEVKDVAEVKKTKAKEVTDDSAPVTDKEKRAARRALRLKNKK